MYYDILQRLSNVYYSILYIARLRILTFRVELKFHAHCKGIHYKLVRRNFGTVDFLLSEALEISRLPRVKSSTSRARRHF